MKKILLTIALINLAYCSFSQLNKGDFVINGGLNYKQNRELFDNSKNYFKPEQKHTTFNFNPKVGVFVLNKGMIGLNLRYSYDKLTRYITSYGDINYIVNNIYLDYYSNKKNELSFGPFLRYYFSFSKTALFLEMDYNLGFGKSIIKNYNFTVHENDITTVKNKLRTFGFGPGILIWLNNNLAIEGLLKYYSTYEKIENKYADDSHLHSTNKKSRILQFEIGFSYYFSKK